MMIQAKTLKDALKKIKAEPAGYSLHVKTEINYRNGNIGNASSVIKPLTAEQEQELNTLIPHIKILKPDNPKFYWVVIY